MIERLSWRALLPFSTAAPISAQSSSPPAVRWSGYIQARETYQSEVGLTGSINRARLTASGSVRGDVGRRVQGEFRTGSPGRGWSTSRAIGDPGVTRGLGLAQVQVIF